jgi:hypothetical protein
MFLTCYFNESTNLGGIDIFDFSGYHDISSYDSFLLETLTEYVVKLRDVRSTEYNHKSIYYIYEGVLISP